MSSLPPRQLPPGHDFPSTRWSRILAAPGARDLDALARDYAGPIRAWLQARQRGAGAGAGAEELLQEAFAWLLEARLFDRADPARGSFRALLKTALARFLIERHRRQQAQKRGGGRAALDLDAVPEPIDPRAPAPDEVLDAAWRRQLLERAAARLEAELVAAGKAVHYRLFADYFLADDAVDHAALAARHGCSRTDVSNWLDHAKRRYRALLRALVEETVAGPEELAAELRWLFGPGGDAGRR